ncbi:MAG: sugar phosphate nucleotidyltransferase [bacterium]|nr:sugar phosphate nucleotidyltransferase [bacterium]
MKVQLGKKTNEGKGNRTITTAVLPVAGLGTRIMPLTLHQPKAMIGIVDRPIIHYIIDEIVAAGIKHIVLVTGPNQPEFKKYINHLEKNPDWRKLNIKFDFAIQDNLWGNGDAVYAARNFIKNNEPFLVCFGDDLMDDSYPPLKTMVNLFTKTGAPIIALEKVPKKVISQYGVVKITKSAINKDLYQIKDVVEKPKINEAPSDLAIIGRYLLTHDILNSIEKLFPHQDKEIALADALKKYALAGGKIYGWQFRGKRFDAGSKIGLLKAQVYFGLQHEQLGPEFGQYLHKIKNRR